MVPALAVSSQPGSRGSGIVSIFVVIDQFLRRVFRRHGGRNGFLAALVEFVPEFFHETLGRPGAGFAESADGSAGDVVGDVLQRCRDPASTPPPSNIRSVIFFIQSEPSRQGVHWPQLSWA